jgi:hypothetical protein
MCTLKIIHLVTWLVEFEMFKIFFIDAYISHLFICYLFILILT